MAGDRPRCFSVNRAHRPHVYGLSPTGLPAGSLNLSEHQGPGPSRITYPCHMTVQPAGDRPGASLEVPREELLRRGRPIASLQQLVIEELTDDEADAFWAALKDA